MTDVTDVAALETALFQFFEQLLLQTPAAIAVVNALASPTSDETDRLCYPLEPAPFRWRFRLKGLHACIATADTLPYSRFRQQLFQTEINRRLGAVNAELVIYENAQHIDRTVYCLRTVSLA